MVDKFSSNRLKHYASGIAGYPFHQASSRVKQWTFEIWVARAIGIFGMAWPLLWFYGEEVPVKLNSTTAELLKWNRCGVRTVY
jgi:hypothetical protein